MDGPARFSEVKQLVPDLSDRLLSERMKELESEGIVRRRVVDDTPVRVEYALTVKGEALEPAVARAQGCGRVPGSEATRARALGAVSLRGSHPDPGGAEWPTSRRPPRTSSPS